MQRRCKDVVRVRRLTQDCAGGADINDVMEMERTPVQPRIVTKRDRTRAEIYVYLPLRGTVMSLLQANAVLREREPYVLMQPGDRPARRTA